MINNKNNKTTKTTKTSVFFQFCQPSKKLNQTNRLLDAITRLRIIPNMTVYIATCPICELDVEGTFFERSPDCVEMVCPACNMWVYGDVIQRYYPENEKQKRKNSEIEPKTKKMFKK